jgi:hypothetical protein
VAEFREGKGQINGESSLADPSFARTYGNDGVNSGQRLRPLLWLSVRVSAQEITWKEESKR